MAKSCAREKLKRHTATKVLTTGILDTPIEEASNQGYSQTPEPLNFFVEHSYQALPRSEYERLLKAMPADFFTVLHADTNSDAPYYRFSAYSLDNGKWRVLISNTHWQYIYGMLITDRVMKNIVPINEFRGRPFWIEARPDGKAGSLIYLRVPPLGVAVVDVEFVD